MEGLGRIVKQHRVLVAATRHGAARRERSWRLTRPAAQALRYSAGPTIKHNAAILLR